eukprot:scaffold27132_cov39-Phaeocystis_antarctica.AAC.1
MNLLKTWRGPSPGRNDARFGSPDQTRNADKISLSIYLIEERSSGSGCSRPRLSSPRTRVEPLSRPLEPSPPDTATDPTGARRPARETAPTLPQPLTGRKHALQGCACLGDAGRLLRLRASAGGAAHRGDAEGWRCVHAGDGGEGR